jgi:hypothetical protein
LPKIQTFVPAKVQIFNRACLNSESVAGSGPQKY